jgi:hypothetical protein
VQPDSFYGPARVTDDALGDGSTCISGRLRPRELSGSRVVNASKAYERETHQISTGCGLGARICDSPRPDADGLNGAREPATSTQQSAPTRGLL